MYLIVVILIDISVILKAEVFRTKTTESMSFPLSLLSLIVTALWVFYSYLVQDIFIKVNHM